MNFKELTKIKYLRIDPKTIVMTKKCYCGMPYDGHPNGCPNYGKSDMCPPKAKVGDDIPHIYNTYYLVYAEFDFKTYCDNMRSKHPNFTDKQIRNLLWYQNAVRHILEEKIMDIEFINRDKPLYIFGSGRGLKRYSMEAVGIQVFETCANNNIILEGNLQPNGHTAPIKNTIRFVNLVCSMHTKLRFKYPRGKKLMGF